MKTPSSSVRKALLLIVLQSLVYGFGNPISKMAYDHVAVYSLLTVRYGIAVLALAALFGRQTLRELRAGGLRLRDWLPACLCIAASYLLSNTAMQYTSVTAMAFLASLSVVITPLLTLVVSRRRPHRSEPFILVLAAAGLYLLCGYGGLTEFGWGDVLVLLSAVMMALALLLSERGMAAVSPGTLTLLQAVTSALLALVCALVFDGGVFLSGADGRDWLIIVYLGVTCTAGGYLLQNAATRCSSARTVALIQCTYPLATAVFSLLMLDERLTPVGWIGAALILLSTIACTLTADEK